MIKLPSLLRPKTEAEKQAARQARQEKQAEQELRKQQITEAQFYAQMIPNALARLKIASISKKDNKLQVNKVKVRPPVLIHEDYYMIEILTARLPYGVRVDHLRDEETLTTLSAACRTAIEARFTPNEGFWYLVPRRGGLGIIPRIVDYNDCVALMPKSANIWAFPIGVSENKRLVWIDLRKTPHMMIIGSTGTGKTVFLKSLIFTLAMNCSPKRLRMVICDFKRGPDFKALTDLPHLGTPLPIGHTERTTGLDEETGEIEKEKISDYADRVLIHLDEITDVLRWGKHEIDRRNGMFDEDVTDITRWNAKHRRNPLPHVLIIIDEIGVIMNRLKGKAQGELTEHLADIAMLGRSAGIHLVLGMQKLVKKVLDGAISDNIEARIVGVCASGPQSASAMGNGSWAAARLPKIKGRAMWRDVDGEIEVQLPWVAPGRAVELTNAVIDRWSGDQDNEDQTATEIFKWCLENHEGHYHIDRVYQHWKKYGLTRAQVQSIREEYLLSLDDDGPPDPVFTIDEVEYVLLPHIPGQRPGRVIPLARYNEAINADTVPVQPAPVEPDVDPLRLFRYALNELDGSFSYRAVYDAFKGEVSAHKVKTIAQEWEGRTFEVEGVTYQLLPPEQVNKPRTIAPVGCESRDTARAPEVSESESRGVITNAELPEIEAEEGPQNVIAEQHHQVRRPGEGQADIEPDDDLEIPDWLQSIDEVPE